MLNAELGPPARHAEFVVVWLVQIRFDGQICPESGVAAITMRLLESFFFGDRPWSMGEGGKEGAMNNKQTTSTKKDKKPKTITTRLQ